MYLPFELKKTPGDFEREFIEAQFGVEASHLKMPHETEEHGHSKLKHYIHEAKHAAQHSSHHAAHYHLHHHSSSVGERGAKAASDAYRKQNQNDENDKSDVEPAGKKKEVIDWNLGDNKSEYTSHEAYDPTADVFGFEEYQDISQEGRLWEGVKRVTRKVFRLGEKPYKPNFRIEPDLVETRQAEDVSHHAHSSPKEHSEPPEDQKPSNIVPVHNEQEKSESDKKMDEAVKKIQDEMDDDKKWSTGKKIAVGAGGLALLGAGAYGIHKATEDYYDDPTADVFGLSLENAEEGIYETLKMLHDGEGSAHVWDKDGNYVGKWETTEKHPFANGTVTKVRGKITYKDDGKRILQANKSDHKIISKPVGTLSGKVLKSGAWMGVGSLGTYALMKP